MTERSEMRADARSDPRGLERDLTVVVPVHDDHVEFEAIVERYGDEFARRGLSYEFVFVLDGTSERLFEELGRRRPAGVSVRLIKFNQPFGESIALAAGVKIARGRIVLSLPQYVQNEPADIQKVLDAIDRGADVVTCWRRPRVDPILNRVQSWFFNTLMRALTRARVHDLNCQQRAMVRRVFEDVNVQGDMYRFLPVLAWRAGYEVAEVQVRHLKEESRQSLFGSLFGFGVYVRRVLDVAALLFLTRFSRKPLRFFGPAGSLIFLVGLVICVVLLVEFILGGNDPDTRLKNRTWLIFGTLMIVLGVTTFFHGLVAEIVIFTQGRNLRDYKVGRVAEGTDPAVAALSRDGAHDGTHNGKPPGSDSTVRLGPVVRRDSQDPTARREMHDPRNVAAPDDARKAAGDRPA